MESIEAKLEGMIQGVCKIATEHLVGKLSTETRLILYERTVSPTITFNLECWTDIGQRNWEKLERIQGKALRRILMLPANTPYLGILKETGIWNVERKVDYQRLMLYQNMMESDDERLGKQIIQDQ